MKYLLLIIGLLLSFQPVISQEYINGKIIDAKSGEPLSFVNIVFNPRGSGTVSNIDGEFSIRITKDVKFLKFSYLGYYPFHADLGSVGTGHDLVIRLEQKTYDINEVSVIPGINPAHRIIYRAIENRDRNNPEKMKSFSYHAYNKMFFTVQFDTLADQKENETSDSIAVKTSSIPDPNDSSLREAIDFFEKQHLFLMEFVSEREFLYPDKNKEIVTASRVSGLKDPFFTLLATQVQSFAFYNDLIMIMDKKYLNPLSQGSPGKYLFILEDTLFTESNDTLFVISYRPLHGKNFDGLKGILHINSNGYAIQDVIAEAAEQGGKFRICIRQKYEWLEDQQWFPVEMNTDIILETGEMKANDIPVTLLGIGKSYLSEITLNPELKNRNFSPVELKVEEDAHKKSEEYWDMYRVVPLTSKDTNTYKLIDSIGQAENFDRSLAVMETLATGYIPWKFLDINYRSLINYNRYEGFRFGLGIKTNRTLSDWFTIGGHFAWGTSDQDFKYGGYIKVFMDPVSETYIQYKYNQDVMESAGFKFLNDYSMTSSENFRRFLIANKDIAEEHEISLGSSLVRYLSFSVFLNQSSKQVTSDYLFAGETDGLSPSGHFDFTEIGTRLRFAWKEKFIETPRGNRISIGTKFPVVNINIIKGIEWLQGDYDYLKLEGRISKTFISKSFGNTSLSLFGGIVDKNIPYPNIYNGHGSYGKFVPAVENSFATMRMNEFVMDRFLYTFFQQDFGSLLFKKGNFRPEFVLVTNAGFGRLKNTSNHENIELIDIRHGYYESGIMINNILRQWFIGYGLGTFYRYGPYSLNKTIDNFTFTFTISFNI